MTREQVAGAITDIINEILPEGDCSEINADQKLREQLELDSMDFLDIVMEIRKRYGIEIPESDYPKLATMNSCIEYLQPKLASK